MRKRTSTNTANRSQLIQNCPLSYTLGLIEGRWKAPVLVYIGKGVSRFGRLKANLPGISEKMLSQTLRALEREGLVTREVFAEVPPRVEYELTSMGLSLLPALQGLVDWVAENSKQVKAARAIFDAK